MRTGLASRLLPAAAFCLAAGSAFGQAGCPTEADRGRPTELTYSDGLVEVHRSLDGIVWQIDGYEGGTWIYRLEVAHGTHLLSYMEVHEGQPDPASLASYDYGLPPAEMPVPVPGGRWQVVPQVTEGGATAPEGQMQAAGAITSVEIGACRYDMIPVLIAYDDPEQYVELINYLPALGLGYLVDSQTASDPGGPIPAIGIRLAK